MVSRQSPYLQYDWRFLEAAFVTPTALRFYRVLSPVLWAVSLGAHAGVTIALIWLAVALGFDSLRNTLERRLKSGPSIDAARLDLQLTIIGFFACALGATAAAIIFASPHPFGQAAGALLAAGGLILSTSQNRVSFALSLFRTSPFTLVLLAFAVQGFVSNGSVSLLLAYPALLAAYIVAVSLSLAAQRRFRASSAEQERLIADLKVARDAALDAQTRAEADAARLELALEGAQAVVWEADFKAGRVIGLEDLEKVIGVRLGERELLKGSLPMVPEEDRARILRAMSGPGSVMRGSVLHRIVREDGRIAWVENRWRRLGEDLETSRLILMTTDVTEREQRLSAMLGLVEAARQVVLDRTGMLNELATHLQLETPQTGSREELAPANGEGSEAALIGRLESLLNDLSQREVTMRRMVETMREAQEAADGANRAKSQFLANMSHELRTPLNAIIGYGEILREEAEEKSDTSTLSDLNRILAAARRLLTLINEVLDLSKIEAGRMDVEVMDFDVAELACDVVATVTPSAEANGNTITIAMSSDIGGGRSDGFKLSQCLLNLLSNAAKFTRNGQIGFYGWRERSEGRDWLVFEVSDSGVGIAAEKLSSLFQPFVQADSSTTRSFGGTGLGLAITRRIAHLLGGEVYVDSTLGKGSTFTLRVPASFGITPAGEERATSAEEDDPRRPVIVVIDDDASTRDLAHRALGRIGFSVRSAANAADGLALLRATSPALLILDINLPDRSGWDMLEELRESEQGRDLPVLIQSIEDDRARAMAYGACERLVKPVDRDKLAAAALRFARRRPEVTFTGMLTSEGRRAAG